jgi:hypothetical protein
MLPNVKEPEFAVKATKLRGLLERGSMSNQVANSLSEGDFMEICAFHQRLTDLEHLANKTLETFEACRDLESESDL